MSEAQSAIAHPRSEIGKIVGVSMIARLAHDTSVRMVYPFLPEIAAGLRLSIDQIGVVLSLRSGIGIISPLFGAISDRVGHRRSMSIGMVVLAIGLGLVGAAEGLLLPSIGLVLTGVASAVYIPSLQAYVSERVPYARRGRAMGAIEMTWAVAGMIGLPIIGLLIDPLGWRAPFIGLSVAATTCAALTLNLPETPSAARAHAEPVRVSLITRNRSAVMFLLVWLLLFFAFENIQVGYGSWFENRFGLSPNERGLAQTLFGIFEITASAGSSAFLDRIGKKRGVVGGLTVACLGYAMLVVIGPFDVRLALGSMGVTFLGFEFSVVSGIPILSEQVPQARGTMLALGVTASSVGRMIAAVLGSALMAGPGFTAAALVSALAAAVTVIVFARGVHE